MDFIQKTLIGIVLVLMPWMALTAGQAKYVEHVLLYQSVDQHGDSLTLSGKVTVPTKEPKGVILIPHYTIASNDEVPSNSDKGEQQYFRDDYILVMPDYLGYGASRDRVHPYLHGELTARNCVDMLLAAQPVIDSLVVESGKWKVESSIDTISILGYSQGGATALWILKLLEEEYADRIHVKACYAGSGPYDVAATYDVAIAENKVGMPMVIPMLVMGTSEAYDLNLQRDIFLTPYMDSLYDDYVTSKSHKFTELYFKMLNHKVSHWLSEKGMDLSQPETRKLYEGMLRSSLVHMTTDPNERVCPDWRPKTKVYVMHSYKDGIVTFRCAESLRQCWGNLENVTYDFGNYGSHLRSAKRFYKVVKKKLLVESRKQIR